MILKTLPLGVYHVAAKPTVTHKQNNEQRKEGTGKIREREV
jgi:hypothetical protein